MRGWFVLDTSEAETKLFESSIKIETYFQDSVVESRLNLTERFPLLPKTQ